MVGIVFLLVLSLIAIALYVILKKWESRLVKTQESTNFYLHSNILLQKQDSDEHDTILEGN